MSPLIALSSVWRQYRPRPSPHTGTRQLVAALHDGASLGEALQLTAATLAKIAVHEAAARFDGGVLALFIVDVRDSLRRQLLEASATVMDVGLTSALCSAAKAVDDDTFVQHLINSLLKATDLYVESMPVESLREARCAREVTALFQRSLCVLISRSDSARRCGERTRRVEFIPMPPQPSRP
jgi:hypothetical protein